MSSFMTPEEQDKFLTSLRWDCLFRKEVRTIILDNLDLDYDLVQKVANIISNDVSSTLGYCYKDARDDIIKTWGKDVIDAAKTEVLEEIEQQKEMMVERITMQVAAGLLDEDSKKLLKSKVENNMMKMRTFRSDLLDLDDDDL